MTSIITVLGAWSEIITLSSLLPLLEQGWTHTLVHTGQSVEADMADIFFEDLRLPAPLYSLAVGSMSHAKQLARIIVGLEEILEQERAKAVIVQGDTNTTLGGAIAAAKLGVPVIHIEAGYRTHNRSMPEEQNRIVVDHLADYLFAPDEGARDQLLREGIPASRVFVTGSVGIDACLRNWGYASTRPTLRQFSIQRCEYGLVSIHRAAHIAPDVFSGILTALNRIAEELPLIFPMHPRTRAAFNSLSAAPALHPNLRVTEPLGYLDTLALIGNARIVLTDSGGIQEETAALQIPTLVLREETEWQAYVNAGTHQLVGTTPETVIQRFLDLVSDGSLDAMRLRSVPASVGASSRIATILATVLPRDQPIPLPVAYHTA